MLIERSNPKKAKNNFLSLFFDINHHSNESMKKITLLTILIFLLISTNSFSQNYVGTWKGEVHEQDSIIQFKMNVMIQQDTTIGAFLLEPTTCLLADSSFYGNDFHFKSRKRSPSYTGQRDNITFTGELTSNKNQLRGELTINGKVYQLEMLRSDKPIFRPQEPQRPFPYYSEDVKFVNKKDQTVLAGTLTLPQKEGKFPAVILKGGSFPSNRDGETNQPGAENHKMFMVLADYLTRNGIAVLRCDDRGIGRSSGDFWESTPVDLAGDLLSGYEYLASRKEIKSNDVGLIGHSEGGIDVSIAASQCPEIKFVVMLGCPGISLKEVFEYQTYLKYQNGDIPKEEFEFEKKISEKFYQLLNQNLGSKAITDSLIRLMDKDIVANINSKNEANSEKGIETEIVFRYIISLRAKEHNLFNLKAIPSDYIGKLTCPVLSLNGNKDNQITAEINQNAIRLALLKAGNKDFKIMELAGLNHSFQECQTGSVKESLTIEQTFSPQALKLITEWISEHVVVE